MPEIYAFFFSSLFQSVQNLITSPTRVETAQTVQEPAIGQTLTLHQIYSA